MKARLVKESMDNLYFLEEIRDAILAGDVYKPAPSKYDPDQKAVYIPYLSDDSHVFYYTLLGGSDVYGIEMIDSLGTIWNKAADIAGGQFEEDEIIEEIQNIFPKPPTNMKEIGQAHDVEDFIDWFQTYGDQDY